MTPKITPRSHRGFTLAELAIVLVILAVLASVLVIPLSSQLEARQRAEAEATLRDIRAALIGFAILNHRLPCPTTILSPSNPEHGKETTDAGACTAASGSSDAILPWRTLGIPPLDPWGNHWRYRADRRFSEPNRTPITSTHPTLDDLRIYDHTGTALTASDETAVAIVFSLGANLAADGHNIAYENGSGAIYEAGEPTTTYDDMVIWIGRPLLIARMAEAGSF